MHQRKSSFFAPQAPAQSPEELLLELTALRAIATARCSSDKPPASASFLVDVSLQSVNISPELVQLMGLSDDWLESQFSIQTFCDQLLDKVKPEQRESLLAQLEACATGISLPPLSLSGAEGKPSWWLQIQVLEKGKTLLGLIQLDGKHITSPSPLASSYLKQLEQQALMLRLGEEVANMGFLIWDIAKREMQPSANLNRLLGLPKGDLSFDHFLSQFLANVHPKDRGGLETKIRQTQDLGQLFETECRLLIGGKKLRWISLRMLPYENQQIIVSISDISGIKEAARELSIKHEELATYNEELLVSQEELLEQQDLLRQINQSLQKQQMLLDEGEQIAKSGTFLIQLDTQKVEYSAGLLSCYGLRDQEINPHSFWDHLLRVTHPEDIEVFQEYLQHSMEGAPESHEYRILLEDGSHRWLRILSRMNPTETQLIGSIVDISREKKAEAELLETQKELEQFVYSVSHDLRAPVRHIEGYTDWVITDAKDRLKESELDNLKKVIFAAQRLGKMVDELLNYSRSRTRKPVKEWLELNSVLDELIHGDSLIDSEQVNWQIRELPKLYADREMICTLLEILLSNSVKFSADHPHPTIEVWAKTSSRQVDLFVKDNGAGFDMRFADKLFAIFQRLHSRDEFEGTGIGLANAKRIMQLHEGSITGESELGKWTLFKMTFPINEFYGKTRKNLTGGG